MRWHIYRTRFTCVRDDGGRAEKAKQTQNTNACCSLNRNPSTITLSIHLRRVNANINYELPGVKHLYQQMPPRLWPLEDTHREIYHLLHSYINYGLYDFIGTNLMYRFGIRLTTCGWKYAQRTLTQWLTWTVCLKSHICFDNRFPVRRGAHLFTYPTKPLQTILSIYINLYAIRTTRRKAKITDV